MEESSSGIVKSKYFFGKWTVIKSWKKCINIAHTFKHFLIGALKFILNLNY